MADETADALRDMALHRGLKLVRSRRRKPGAGDFGKFGLTDATGKALLGIGKDGLTASAADIENFLRAGATSTWQQSAKITPARKAEKSTRESRDAKGAKLSSARRDRERSGQKNATTPLAKSDEGRSENRVRKSIPRKAAKADLQSLALPAPEPKPELTIRSATSADAGGIAALLKQLPGVAADDAQIAAMLATLRKAGAGVSIAQVGDIVGCIGWALLPTLQHGLIGRVTVLLVHGRYRRRGIGSQLLDQAETAMRHKGCAVIEAMSDIDLKNSHGFFRSAGFEQKSYRFIRAPKGQ
jgi:ribosomal protein S18 acetylase RimI-like enzyme